MLEPKEAVGKAQEYLVELRPDLADRSVRLEEIGSFGERWRLTFAALFPLLTDAASHMERFPPPNKIDKVAEVCAKDGSFVSPRDRAAC